MAGLDSFRELRPRSVASEVADSIRAAINSGALAPGHHLVEREIAKSLGVSTIAVREAFGLLGRRESSNASPSGNVHGHAQPRRSARSD